MMAKGFNISETKDPIEKNKHRFNNGGIVVLVWNIVRAD